MIAKSTRIAIEVVAGTLAVVVLVSLVALWRLSKEPVRLDFMTPHIEAALDELDSGFFVRIGRTELIWAGERRSIEFHTRDLRIRNRDGVTVAAFPDVAVRLSLRALVQGVIAPTVVEVAGARIRLLRDADGSFAIVRQVAGEAAAESGADFSAVLPAIVQQLMSKPDVGQPLSFLTAVRILRGQVIIDDRRLDLVWRAPVADIELRRDSAGLAGEVDMVLAVGQTQTRLSGDFLFPRGGKRISARGQFVGLRSEALIPLLPKLGPLAGLTMAFDGALQAALAVDGRVESVDFEVAGVNGRLDAPDTFTEPLELRRIALRGRAIGAEHQIDIESLSLQLGAAERPGPEILADVSLATAGPDFGGDLSVGAEVVVTGLEVSDLDRYWPVSLKPGRKWVVRNLSRGHLDEVRVQTALHLPGGRMDQTELRRLDGTLRYRDLAVHYWRPMPPATGISGTAVFDDKSISFTSRGARLQDLRVESGDVKIVGLGAGKETVKVDLDIGGPLGNGFELLDHDRLRLIRKLGIDPAGAEGRFTGRVKFHIPIYVRTTFDNLGVWAEAKLEQATIRRFLLGQDATEGNLDVTVDKAAMEVRGPLRFGGVPLEIVWNQNFAEDAAVRSQLEARIPEIDDAGREALGLDFAPYLEGPVAVDMAYSSDRDKNGRLAASIDLRDAGLSLPQVYWSKAAGLRGNAELTLGLVGLKLTTIEKFDVSAGTLRASGSGRFDDNGKRVTSLALDDLTFDGTELERVSVDWLGEGTAVHIGGGTVDAVPFLAGEDARKVQAREPHQPPPAAAQTNAPAPEATAPELERPALTRSQEPAAEAPPLREPRTEPYVFTPFALKAPDLSVIQFGPGRFIESAALELRRGRNGWQRIAVEALLPTELWSPEPAPKKVRQTPSLGTEQRDRDLPEVDTAPPPEEKVQVPPPKPEPRTLRIDYRPQDAGGYGFVFESNDMGAALRALGKFDTIHGGRVAIVGTSAGPVPNAPLDARIEARDYVLVDAPAMVRLLTVASLTGINDSMKGEGIRFSRLIGAFTLTDGIMETELIRAFGPALGLTARGKIDFDEFLVDLEGTAVPAYSVNRVLNLIPLLGPILTGREGEGIFAVTYHMTGDLDDPDVDVNALSALAPGFLRALFSGGGGDGDDIPRALPERPDR